MSNLMDTVKMEEISNKRKRSPLVLRRREFETLVAEVGVDSLRCTVSTGLKNVFAKMNTKK